METAIILLIYILVVIFEYIPIIKKKKRKLIFVYSLFLITSFLISILTIWNIKVPSPTDFIEKLFKF